MPGPPACSSRLLQAGSSAGGSAGLGSGLQAPPDTSAQGMVPAPPPLRLAARLVAACVSERICSGAAGDLPLEAGDRGGWAPTYAIANCYQDGSCGVGAHSDRLTPLGPAPIIASLSLGASRTFRLHRQQRLQLRGSGGAAGTGSSGSAGAGSTVDAATVGMDRVDMELPHNALCIMWPPCQEAWAHEVGLKEREGCPAQGPDWNGNRLGLRQQKLLAHVCIS